MGNLASRRRYQVPADTVHDLSPPPNGAPLMFKTKVPSPGFQQLVKEARGGTFQRKREILEQQLRSRHQPGARALQLRVPRYLLFDASAQLFETLHGMDLSGPLMISFDGEEGRDDGGLSRHWFHLIAQEVLSPERDLFRQVSEEQYSYQIRPSPNPPTEVLRAFNFFGKAFGKALFDGYLMPAHFTTVFYKHMLRKEILLEDMRSVDKRFHDSLKWILDNDIEEAGLGLYFVLDEQEEVDGTQGSAAETQSVQIDLVPGGAEREVTNSNKFEYVTLLVKAKLDRGVKAQLEEFMSGFHELIPQELIAGFDEKELELLTSGLPLIDLEDWKRHTVYKAGYTSDHKVVRWFWEIVESWSQEQRAQLLQFVTGTSMVPPEGFKGLFGSNGLRQFHVQQIRDTKRLPQAITCFNELWLPPYRSKKKLEELLLLAMNEGGHQFLLR